MGKSIGIKRDLGHFSPYGFYKNNDFIIILIKFFLLHKKNRRKLRFAKNTLSLRRFFTKSENKIWEKGMKDNKKKYFFYYLSY